MPDTLKKDFLKSIIQKIVVGYDKQSKVHDLNINFQLPVYIEKNMESTATQIAVIPPKSGRKTKNQLTPISNYSTVTDFARFLG